MYYVYLLRLNDSSVYIGSTPNLGNRIKEHQTGECISTKNKRPLELVWYCAYRSRIKALRLEKYLKSGSGTAFRHKRIE